MIDVMFFLLATFMLASLTMQNLHSLRVDLPQGNAAPLQIVSPVTLTVTKDGQIFINQQAVTLEILAATVKPLLAAPDTPITVAADSAAPNGVVVQAMLRAREAGAQRFVFAVRHE
jgi:biopolymer transport protein TolR